MSNFKNQRSYSIVRFFLLCLLFISVVSTAILGYFWVSSEYRQFEAEAAHLRQDYLDTQKEKVKEETLKVVEYIHYLRSRTDLRLKELLKERVYEAYSIADNIYRKNKGVKSGAEIKKMIKEALLPIRFSRGRGYFYLINMDGEIQLYPVKPQYEGQNHMNIRDSNGVYVVKREIELVKKQEEGFLVNTWRLPEFPGVIHSKVSFVKFFSPLNWYIGSKEYREDYEREIQEDILERISVIRFGKNGYIFVFDYDGVVLVNETRRDLIGKNLWNIQDVSGVRFVREMRKVIDQPGGGYVEYTWGKPTNREPCPKISFVSAVPEWRWIIGAGIYLDEIEILIAEKRQVLEQNVEKQVWQIGGLFLLIMGIVLVITLYFSRRLGREFKVFTTCFDESSICRAKIDKERLLATELKLLADSANSMLDERLRIERSLRESEERLAVTFRSIHDGVIAVDTNARVVLMNRAAEKLTGWSSLDAIGKSIDDILSLENENTREPVNAPVMNAINSGELMEFGESMVLQGRDGGRWMISYSVSPIRDKENKTVGAVMVIQDISERKKMEEELRKAHKLESLGLLAGGIAHDFNNLLTGVLGNINLARALVSPGHNVYEPLVLAEKAVLQSKRLTQQLLTFARGSSPIKQLHHPRDLVEDAVSFALRGSRVKYSSLFPEGLWAVNVDAGQMVQVLNNITINSLQAMPDGGTIDISAVNVPSGLDTGLPLADRKYVKVMVKDNGVGIHEEVIKRIFDPYFTTKPKGSGLGLTSAYSIVKKHEGYIDVESEPGKGTTFTVYMPAVDKPITPATDREEEKTIRGRGCILVMDDDAMVADVAEKMLKLLGYECRVTSNGEETIKIYQEAMKKGEPFVGAIMDLTIPGGMGGAETMNRLLQIDPGIKAIVSSGYSNDPIMANYPDYGFSGCIVKPYLIKELAKTLRQVLGPGDTDGEGL